MNPPGARLRSGLHIPRLFRLSITWSISSKSEVNADIACTSHSATINSCSYRICTTDRDVNCLRCGPGRCTEVLAVAVLGPYGLSRCAIAQDHPCISQTACPSYCTAAHHECPSASIPSTRMLCITYAVSDPTVWSKHFARHHAEEARLGDANADHDGQTRWAPTAATGHLGDQLQLAYQRIKGDRQGSAGWKPPP